MNYWPNIDLWHLPQMKGDFDELCDILACTQVATVVAVISYSNGGASIRKYCSTHEYKGFETLKRNYPRVLPVDHRPLDKRLPSSIRSFKPR
jgi:hypothetical protein